jgi:hypothetical protein
MSKALVYRPGPQKHHLELPADINLDLHAFCKWRYRATMTEVIQRALKLLIEKETASPEARREFEEVRRSFSGEPLRLIPSDTHSVEQKPLASGEE